MSNNTSNGNNNGTQPMPIPMPFPTTTTATTPSSNFRELKTQENGNRKQKTKNSNTTNESSNRSNSKVPSFIQKLMDIVNDPSTDAAISWSENGETFKVHDVALLSRDILPKYFKHNNFNSLVRQLNMYGFHKVVGIEGGIKGDEEWEFVHPCVRRDKPLWLHHIKRKDPAHKRQVTRKEVDGVVKDLQSIKGEQQILSSKFVDMQRENTALWQEVSQLRHKNQQQQRMISKILEFLHKLSRIEAIQPSSNNPTKRSKQLSIGMSEQQQQQQQSSQPQPNTFPWQSQFVPQQQQQHEQSSPPTPFVPFDAPPPFSVASVPTSIPFPSSPLHTTSLPTTLPTSLPTSFSGTSFPVSLPQLSSSSNYNQQQQLQPQQRGGFANSINTLNGAADKDIVETILSPALSSHNDRIGEQRQRLESIGLDPSLLHGLWNAADDHSREGEEDGDALGLDPFDVAMDSNDLNVQPSVVYSPLDEEYPTTSTTTAQ
eukprot:m.178013 g.178013  ORF g.178013 m.178013 type:complete len:486 (-) comp13553_c1_seq1:235-1692(-)